MEGAMQARKKLHPDTCCGGLVALFAAAGHPSPHRAVSSFTNKFNEAFRVLREGPGLQTQLQPSVSP